MASGIRDALSAASFNLFDNPKPLMVHAGGLVDAYGAGNLSADYAAIPQPCCVLVPSSRLPPGRTLPQDGSPESVHAHNIHATFEASRDAVKAARPAPKTVADHIDIACATLELWQKVLEDNRMLNFMYQRYFGWGMVDPETLRKLMCTLVDLNIPTAGVAVSVGSGSGYIEELLRGVLGIISTDVDPCSGGYKERGVLQYSKMSGTRIGAEIPEAATLFMIWPCKFRGDNGEDEYDTKSLRTFGGKFLVYIGEGVGYDGQYARMTGSPGFHRLVEKEWTELKTFDDGFLHRLMSSLDGGHAVTVYVRSESAETPADAPVVAPADAHK